MALRSGPTLSGQCFLCNARHLPRASLPAPGVTSCGEISVDLVRGHYPSFIARTGSCAGPKSSSCLGFTLVHQVLAGCCEPLLEVGPSRRYLCRSFGRCLAPYPGAPSWCFYPFLPTRHRPSPRYDKVGSHNTRTAASVRSTFRGCKHSFMFRPLPLLATLTAPTVASYRCSAAVTFTSEHTTVCYLPASRIY